MLTHSARTKMKRNPRKNVVVFLLLLVNGIVYTKQLNVARNKWTWQSTPYIAGASTFDSSNAIDGLKSDLTAWGGECAISKDFERTATWGVNLASVYSIHNIRIYYRTDKISWDASSTFPGRFLGFYVYVSNTTNRLDGHLCFHDTNYTRSTIPAIADITCPVHGQYVIYYNERLASVKYPDDYSLYAHNELCEVEVYGCLAGSYGPNCSLPCPDNCGDGNCDVETGVCFWCKEGYQGPQCQDECDVGFYGTDCSLPCGHCLDSVQCHPLNGSCLNGCDVGYEGSLCNQTCTNSRYGSECQEQCGYCKDHKPCHHVTGSCSGLCEPGYSGDNCKENNFGQLLANQAQILANQSLMIDLIKGFMSSKKQNSKLKKQDLIKGFKSSKKQNSKQKKLYRTGI